MVGFLFLVYKIRDMKANRLIVVTFFLLTVGKLYSQDHQVSDSVAQTKEIEAVILKSQRKKQFADHANYTFGKDALEQARHSKDLLSTLPELQLDPISNTITSIKGGKTLFLINGIEATDNQIKSIAPTNVVRVEYFDIPPARYSQRADTVVNIITKNPEVGYSYGADSTSALATGFVNGSAYAGYTKGRSDFGLEYTINQRDYNNRIVDKIYDYTINSSHYRSEEEHKDHFGYTNQNIVFRYTNILPNNYTFQSKLNFLINSNFLNGFGESNFFKDSSSEIHNTIHNSSSNYIAPNLDLYFSKILSKKDELSLNFIGTHYKTKSVQYDYEWINATGEDIFNNNMNLDAKQTGIVVEVAHNHSFEKGKLSSGYRISNTSVNNELNNLLGYSKFNVNYLEQYVYTEYSGKWNKLAYRLGIGVNNIHNKNVETVNDQWELAPKLVFGYQLPKNQSIRFTSSYKSESPWASALSNNIVQIAPNIVQQGNPYLKPQSNLFNNLIYSVGNKYIDINAKGFYNIVFNSINQYFVFTPKANLYTLTYENTKYLSEYGIQVSGMVKPFGNQLLTLKFSVAPSSQSIYTKRGDIVKNDYIANSFALISQYKNFSLFYQFNIPYYTLSGAFLNRAENQNHIFLEYRYKNWAFSTGSYWVGMSSQYVTKTLPESEVNSIRNSKIYNNKNMLIIGLTYDLSTGKKLQIQKKLNNNTTPAIIF